jgi:hypothetical protein
MEAATATPATETPAPPAEAGTEAHSGPGASQGNGQAPEAGSAATTESDERDEQGRYLSREAANYRRRLRDTEAERDQLREQLDRLQRAEVERLATGAGLAVVADVWQFGATLDTLRTEAGDIDPETVTGVVADIIGSRPGLQAPVVGSFGGGRGAAAAGPHRPKVGLSALLKPGSS